MRRKINNLISVLYSAIRIIILKVIHNNQFQSGMIQRISPNVVLEFNHGSKVVLGKHIRIHSGSKVKVRSNGRLTIGDNVKINYYCIITCHNDIYIGDGTEFGPSVYVYDHDHNYMIGLEADSDQEKFLYAPVHIGKQCWIGANTIILRGSYIGDNCVIGAGCIIKGMIPDGSIVVQKREQISKRRAYDEQ